MTLQCDYCALLTHTHTHTHSRAHQEGHLNRKHETISDEMDSWNRGVHTHSRCLPFGSENSTHKMFSIPNCIRLTFWEKTQTFPLTGTALPAAAKYHNTITQELTRNWLHLRPLTLFSWTKIAIPIGTIFTFIDIKVSLVKGLYLKKKS